MSGCLPELSEVPEISGPEPKAALCAPAPRSTKHSRLAGCRPGLEVCVPCKARLHLTSHGETLQTSSKQIWASPKSGTDGNHPCSRKRFRSPTKGAQRLRASRGAAAGLAAQQQSPGSVSACPAAMVLTVGRIWPGAFRLGGEAWKATALPRYPCDGEGCRPSDKH